MAAEPKLFDDDTAVEREASKPERGKKQRTMRGGHGVRKEPRPVEEQKTPLEEEKVDQSVHSRENKKSLRGGHGVRSMARGGRDPDQ